MSYSNIFLREFAPVFGGIVRALRISPRLLAVEAVDEESGDCSLFEAADIKDALKQIAPDLNFLTIYTERPAYFREFAETMYEENGLIITILPKHCMGKRYRGNVRPNGRAGYGKNELLQRLVLDFEWEGGCPGNVFGPGNYYIPIHKKPWEKRGNLDIAVPIGYNTVIVKGVPDSGKKPIRDRLEEAFYRE